MKKISLTQGLFALIDDKDENRINKHKWYAVKSGKTHYAATMIPNPNGKLYYKYKMAKDMVLIEDKREYLCMISL